jgi:hypothetical protein
VHAPLTRLVQGIVEEASDPPAAYARAIRGIRRVTFQQGLWIGGKPSRRLMPIDLAGPTEGR